MKIPWKYHQHSTWLTSMFSAIISMFSKDLSNSSKYSSGCTMTADDCRQLWMTAGRLGLRSGYGATPRLRCVDLKRSRMACSVGLSRGSRRPDSLDKTRQIADEMTWNEMKWHQPSKITKISVCVWIFVVSSFQNVFFRFTISHHAKWQSRQISPWQVMARSWPSEPEGRRRHQSDTWPGPGGTRWQATAWCCSTCWNV